MPVTKTARRALKTSSRKTSINKIITSRVETAMRIAKKTGKKTDLSNAYKELDRASKKKLIHKNKASRLKSRITKFINKKASKSSKK